MVLQRQAHGLIIGQHMLDRLHRGKRPVSLFAKLARVGGGLQPLATRQAFTREVYGAQHPYGVPLGGTYAAVEAMTLEAVREFYLPFESLTLPATGDLYEHEMPGGQYTNLREQANAMGLGHRWREIEVPEAAILGV